MPKKGTLIFKRVKSRKITLKNLRLMHGGEGEPINLREQNVDRIDNVGHFLIDNNNNDNIYLYPKYMNDNQPLIPLYIAPNEAGRTVEYNKQTHTLIINYRQNGNKVPTTLRIRIGANDA